MAAAKFKPKGQRYSKTAPGSKHPARKVATPEKFDALVDEYVEHQEKVGAPLTLTAALLWMGIYDRHTLDAYARRNGFGRSVDRLRAIIADGYEQRLHTGQPTGAIFALKNMGWSDRQEHTFPDLPASPIKVEVTFVNPSRGKGKGRPS